jgi:hypothetical protein
VATVGVTGHHLGIDDAGRQLCPRGKAVGERIAVAGKDADARAIAMALNAPAVELDLMNSARPRRWRSLQDREARIDEGRRAHERGNGPRRGMLTTWLTQRGNGGSIGLDVWFRWEWLGSACEYNRGVIPSLAKASLPLPTQ